MGPRDPSETNGNAHVAKKSKGKIESSHTSSDASFRDLTPDAVDAGMAAVHQISKILYYVQGHHAEIQDVESIHGFGMRQQARTEELEAVVRELGFQRILNWQDSKKKTIRTGPTPVSLSGRWKNLNKIKQAWITHVKRYNQR